MVRMDFYLIDFKVEMIYRLSVNLRRDNMVAHWPFVLGVHTYSM